MIISIILKNIKNHNIPDKKEFFNKLNNKNISDQDYESCQKYF